MPIYFQEERTDGDTPFWYVAVWPYQKGVSPSVRKGSIPIGTLTKKAGSPPLVREEFTLPITFNKRDRSFHLHNSLVSYVIRIMENGHLEHLYFGAPIADEKSFALYHEETERSQMSVCLPEPSHLSLQYTKQEMPSYGAGDYRSAAMTILQTDGSRVTDFCYASHRVILGKPSLLPLPATYVEDDHEAQTLEITLHDSVINTDLVLLYTIYERRPVITRSSRLVHHGSSPLAIERLMSMSVEWDDMDFTLVDLAGAWARERHVKERRLEMGITAISSLTGTCSSSEHNPFVALKRDDCTEEAGEVYGFSLLYSSNFLAQAECSTFDMTRFMMGINPEGFLWVLEPGESFQTPEAVMIYSCEGLGGMSRAFHRLFRERLARGAWRDRPRPILLNNWEATYFDFDEERLVGIARTAKSCGIELFVLDDGWFGARNDDYRGLGDWYCNLEKIPSGIDGLSKRIETLGMKFGLWVELEMVNKDSDLYRAHPEWMIHIPERFAPHARHQYVLDYSNPEVVDHIYNTVSQILSTAKVSYVKWDMNRYMATPFSNADWTRRGSGAFNHQGEMMHRYILGVYSLYEKLTTQFPNILFESCASGGARFDAGILFWAPQAWCSDDTDAVERQKIQYGTSYVYPLVSMGAHVSAVPNHQLHRTTSLETRGNVAFFGAFGYELDLGMLCEAELATVRQQVAFMKEHRNLIQIEGDLYRLRNPFESNEMAWMVVSPDKTRAIALYCQRLNKVNGSWERLRLAGLDPEKLYEVTCDISPSSSMPEHVLAQYGMQDSMGRVQRICLHGSTLMRAGVPISRAVLSCKGGDFASLLFEIRALEED